jgi:ferredoxin-NADP reductase
MPETEAAALPRRLQWQVATVRAVVDETPRVKSLILDVPEWPGHRAGQHVDIRLTAEDGYRAQRSYSIASAPEAPNIAVTIERIDEGEVSPYLAGIVGVGDKFEIRGPIGGYFVWTAALGGPLLLVAGGSGVVPLMAMLRHRTLVGSTPPTLLIHSSRTYDDIIFRGELDGLAAKEDGLTVYHTLTRSQPVGWSGGSRRIDKAMLADIGIPPAMKPHIYVCGPTPLVEAAAHSLAELGHEPGLIKTERFGPTGG